MKIKISSSRMNARRLFAHRDDQQLVGELHALGRSPPGHLASCYTGSSDNSGLEVSQGCSNLPFHYLASALLSLLLVPLTARTATGTHLHLSHRRSDHAVSFKANSAMDVFDVPHSVD